MPRTRSRSSYQQGSVELVPKQDSPDLWRYRWREYLDDGTPVRRSKVIGDINRYPTKAAVQRAITEFRAEINEEEVKVVQITVAQAWEHFKLHELYDKDVDRSQTTIDNYLVNMKNHILPRLGKTPLEDVKAVQVESWLRTLVCLAKDHAIGEAPQPPKGMAPGTKAKIRNTLSSLFTHCIRHELYNKINPISTVRQGARRVRKPDTLELEEIIDLIQNVQEPAIRMMVDTAAAAAFALSPRNS
jgi:integrase